MCLWSAGFDGWMMALAGMSRMTGPSLHVVCHPLTCSCGCLKVSKESKRGLFHVSCVNFALVPSAKANHRPKPKLKQWRNRLHLLMGRTAKSVCKGAYTQGRENFIATFQFTKISRAEERNMVSIPWPRELWMSFKLGSHDQIGW